MTRSSTVLLQRNEGQLYSKPTARKYRTKIDLNESVPNEWYILALLGNCTRQIAISGPSEDDTAISGDSQLALGAAVTQRGRGGAESGEEVKHDHKGYGEFLPDMMQGQE